MNPYSLLPASNDVTWQPLREPLLQKALCLRWCAIFNNKSPCLLQSPAKDEKLAVGRLSNNQVNLIDKEIKYELAGSPILPCELRKGAWCNCIPGGRRTECSLLIPAQWDLSGYPRLHHPGRPPQHSPRQTPRQTPQLTPDQTPDRFPHQTCLSPSCFSDVQTGGPWFLRIKYY